MPSIKNSSRRDKIPIIYTRGNHYDVGFDVGQTFSEMIKYFLTISKPLREVYVPLYETKEGRRVYESTLAKVEEDFPQYVRELRGTADGAEVPFHELFLLHMDEILPKSVQGTCGHRQPTGCSTICVNEPGQEILGHTEDALTEVLNLFYFVSAHITEEEPQGKWKVREERFTSLCYPGHLPGYTMNYNHHGLVFSINTLFADKLLPGKTPRHFLTRALLAAENFTQAQQILRDIGGGAGDGCSVNMTFLKQEGDRLFHNAEMGTVDSRTDSDACSQLNIFTASPGEKIYHCNSYLRLNQSECPGLGIDSSLHRLKTFGDYKEPKCKEDVKIMLSDDTDSEHPVFRDKAGDMVTTIAVGLFDCVAKTWEIYTDKPANSEPIVVLPLVLKK